MFRAHKLYLSLSASMPGEKRVLSPANVALPMDLGNGQCDAKLVHTS